MISTKSTCLRSFYLHMFEDELRKVIDYIQCKLEIKHTFSERLHCSYTVKPV